MLNIPFIIESQTGNLILSTAIPINDKIVIMPERVICPNIYFPKILSISYNIFLNKILEYILVVEHKLDITFQFDFQ